MTDLSATSPRILIVRLSALGDIIHTLPILGALRQQWPGAHLGWLVEPGGASLVQGHPLLDAVHVVPRKAMRENLHAAWRGPMPDLRRELQAQNYGLALDVQGLTKSAFWPWWAKIPRRIGFAGAESREISGWLATERVRTAKGVLHVVQRNLELLRPLNVAALEPTAFPVHMPDAARERAAQILGPEDPAHPLVIMALGAGWATKVWRAERFGQLAKALAEQKACRVALAWGPGEQALVTRTLAAADAAPQIPEAGAGLTLGSGVSALPPTTFVELGAILARAALMVGGDTGPTHLAAALGVPTVSMMGPLDARRNGPFGAHCTTIQHGIPRRAPFWRNHRRWCDPRTDLAGVSVEEMLTACLARLP